MAASNIRKTFIKNLNSFLVQQNILISRNITPLQYIFNYKDLYYHKKNLYCNFKRLSHLVNSAKNQAFILNKRLYGW